MLSLKQEKSNNLKNQSKLRILFLDKLSINNTKI